MTVEETYPFEIATLHGKYIISAFLESDDLLEKYYPLFEKYGYEGNGYCWEGHIVQILERQDKELLNHVEFDPEAGSFHALADSEESQMRFIKILTPIFSDISKLETFIKKADRNRIDD